MFKNKTVKNTEKIIKQGLKTTNQQYKKRIHLKKVYITIN